MTKKDKAKAVITEIIQQSGGDSLEGKTRLFKAFYFAHLFYAKDNADFLTDWPIVRMPKGPGIDDFGTLQAELEKEGKIEREPTNVGPYKSMIFRAVETAKTNLTKAERKAIREAIIFVDGKTGSQLSDITHEHSRSWCMASDGDELNIYLDLLSDEEYQEATERVEKLKTALDSVWNG